MIRDGLIRPLREVYDLGGPVIIVLLAISVLTIAMALYKLWQFRAARVGIHRAMSDAVNLWDRGEREKARALLDKSQSPFAALIALAMQATPTKHLLARLEAQAGSSFNELERGLRLFDSVAQLAPLLGLFGTVIGMIEAFQALQSAGSQVDPSLLAGGIWVALLTTAAGLAVAMPTALILSWLEGRLENERIFVEEALTRILAPTHHPGGGNGSEDHGA